MPAASISAGSRHVHGRRRAGRTQGFVADVAEFVAAERVDRSDYVRQNGAGARIGHGGLLQELRVPRHQRFQC